MAFSMPTQLCHCLSWDADHARWLRSGWASGASSGIGEAIARRLAELGVSLVITARRRDRLDKLKWELESKYGVAVHAQVLDMKDLAAIEALPQTLPPEFQKVHHTTCRLKLVSIPSGRLPPQAINTMPALIVGEAEAAAVVTPFPWASGGYTGEQRGPCSRCRTRAQGPADRLHDNARDKRLGAYGHDPLLRPGHGGPQERPHREYVLCCRGRGLCRSPLPRDLRKARLRCFLDPLCPRRRFYCDPLHLPGAPAPLGYLAHSSGPLCFPPPSRCLPLSPSSTTLLPSPGLRCMSTPALSHQRRDSDMSVPHFQGVPVTTPPSSRSMATRLPCAMTLR